MTEEYLAHSVKEGCPAQSYRDHVSAVTERAVQYATEAGRYCALGSAQLELVARQSGQLHDLGKLDDENQAVLRNPGGKQRHLPHNHVDAGAAALLSEENLYSALAVYSHHRGLPNMAEEGNRGNALFGTCTRRNGSMWTKVCRSCLDGTARSSRCSLWKESSPMTAI